jgi:hypothetical protein
MGRGPQPNDVRSRLDQAVVEVAGAVGEGDSNGRVFTRRFEVEKSPAGFGDFLVARKRFCLRMLRATRRA